jgi:hypothetical protein
MNAPRTVAILIILMIIKACSDSSLLPNNSDIDFQEFLRRRFDVRDKQNVRQLQEDLIYENVLDTRVTTIKNYFKLIILCILC